MKAKLNVLMVLIVVVTMGLAAGVTNADPVGYWKLDETSGSTAANSLAEDYGILKGSPAWVRGHFGGALELDGVDDYVVLSVGDELNFGSNTDFSISLWVKTSGWSNDTVIIGNKDWNSGTSSGWVIAGHESGSGSWQWNYCGSKGTRVDWDPNDVRISDNVWHHLCVTHDRDGYAKFYFDGVFKGREDISDSTGTIDARYPTVLGQDGRERYGVFFKGLIDDVVIFNHALEPEEVTHLYHNGGIRYAEPALRKSLRAARDAQSILENQRPQEAVAFLERRIREFAQYTEKKPGNNILAYEKALSSDLYFTLATAKEAAGAPVQDVFATYRQSVSQLLPRPKYVPTLLWLFRNIPAGDYVDLVRKGIHNSGTSALDSITQITADFESSQNWAAFKLFMDATFSVVNDTTSFAKAMAKGLKKDGIWANEFSAYCQSRAQLAGYVVEVSEELAQEYIEHKDFLKAAEIYEDIASRCGANETKVVYEFKKCESIFWSGQYSHALSELDNFIRNNEATNVVLVTRAILLKGHAYMQLGGLDRASDTFLELIAKYPETKQAPEANFFIGYCDMLRGKYKEATKTLGMVLKYHPQSSYAGKARLCLRRIKRMTE